MRTSSQKLSELSAEEKRTLLAQLLRDKVNRSKAGCLKPRGQVLSILQQVSASRLAPTPVTELSADAVLDPAIQPERSGALPTPAAEAADCFLTGATGFLGAFLLRELLLQTRANIHCLVRANGVAAAQQRFRAALTRYSLWDERVAHRIIAIPGDLAQPWLGLTPAHFEELAGRIDVVYHNGATINFLYNYESIRPSNVLGTQEVLRLACRGQVKPVHFVGTVAVFPLFGEAGETIIHEDDPIDHGGTLVGGYTQSKWVGEKLVRQARDRGLPVSIYRPGAITGDSRRGIGNPDDFTTRFLKGCVELGLAPDFDMQVDMTPVDYVSQAIVHLSKRRESLGRAFHLVNAALIPWGELIGFLRGLGYPVQAVAPNAWQELLVRGNGNGASDALQPLVPMMAEVPVDGLIGLSQVRFDCRHTLEGLAGSGIACHPADARLLRTYVTHWIDSQLFRPPPARNGVHKNGLHKTFA